ncbi:phenylalanine--tRNA ligase subunit alpha [Candidatus Pacearchaeota archaeon]|nr:phenylalanine--tRNA ligase subunit alpha [Candidatus Pacearchaeota archaeon]
MTEKDIEIQKVIESLSPNERKIIPYLEGSTFKGLDEKTTIGKTAIMRALEFLSNKKIIQISIKKERIIELGINGLTYKKQGLPERRLANVIAEKTTISIPDAMSKSGISDNEFKAALGALKRKALINLVNGNIILTGKKEALVEKSLEEKFLETLPKNTDQLEPQEKYSLDKLKSRKNIIDIQDKKTVSFKPTDLGREIMQQNLTPTKDMIEQLTPEILKSGRWKGKKFRRYDLTSPVPRINGGKRHFVNQATDYAKKIWTDMGFKEMSGNMTQSSFWNFDVLFTPQDHPVREMQDTFFIKDKIAKLPDNKFVTEVKKAHEGKIPGSIGWQYNWKDKEAKKVALRTHTTCLSAKTLKEISQTKEFPAKYFSVGKVFRNETLDWSHGFEFNQTEGIVIDENATFGQLIGYLTKFFNKMGFDKIRVRPGYFPYTEPSVEVDYFNPVKKAWVELVGAGMFRPELTIPIFGRHIPVLAWGMGFDRMITKFFNIKDLREMFKNDINKLRDMKIWDK